VHSTDEYCLTMIYEVAQNLIEHIFAIGIFLKKKAEVGFWRVFSVFNGFDTRISFCDTLQSCPHDNFPPYSHFRIIIEKDDVGFFGWFPAFLMVFRPLNGPLSFSDTLRSCSEFQCAFFCIASFYKKRRNMFLHCFRVLWNVLFANKFFLH
jgi:hypothetical protein